MPGVLSCGCSPLWSVQAHFWSGVSLSLPGTFAYSFQGPGDSFFGCDGVLPLPSQTLFFSLPHRFLMNSTMVSKQAQILGSSDPPYSSICRDVALPIWCPWPLLLLLGDREVSSWVAFRRGMLQSPSPLPWPLNPGADGQGQVGEGSLGWECLGRRHYWQTHMASCALDLSICGP